MNRYLIISTNFNGTSAFRTIVDAYTAYEAIEQLIGAEEAVTLIKRFDAVNERTTIAVDDEYEHVITNMNMC